MTKTGTHGHLEQLRDVANDPPSHSTWQRLCESLAGMEGETAAVGLDYVTGHTRCWPSVLKVGRISEPSDIDGPPAYWPLVKVLEVNLRRFEQADVAALARDPSLMQPTTLRVTGVYGYDDRLAELLSSSNLGKVTHLSLDGLRIGPDGARNLVQLGVVRQLTRLDLRHNDLRVSGVETLARASSLDRLESLRLGGSGELRAAGVRALTARPRRRWPFFGRSGGLPALTELDLSLCSIDAEAVGVLAASSLLTGLTSLDLGLNGIDTGTLETLLASPRLGNLETLQLGQNDLDADAAGLLAGDPRLAQVTKLDLMYNQVGDDGIGTLSRSPHLRRLRHLDLEKCGIGDAGAEAITQATFSAALDHLDLRLNQIGDMGAELLARASWGEEMQTLNLWGNRVSRMARRLLLRSTNLARCDLIL